MNINQIPTETVEKINKKYGSKNLRKFLNYYHSGIPEIYWDRKNKTNTDYIASLTEISNVAVLSESVNKSDEYVYEYIKCVTDNKNSTKIIDFVTLNSMIIDKFNQINLEILGELNKYEFVAVVGIKRYGKVYDKFYPAIASVFNTLIHNSLFAKKVIFSIEMDSDNLEKLADMFGEEFMELVVNDFEVFSTNV